jgi:hypothetical protein
VVQRLDSLGACAAGEAPFMQDVARFDRKVDRLLRAVSFLKPKNMMSSQ